MSSDAALIEAAAREAGALAQRMQAAGLTITYKSGDNTPVTEADLAVDGWLKSHLMAARPDYGWLSEETADDASRLSQKRVFVVDPIDGTAAFMKSRPWWSISIAVVEDGLPVCGVVFAPALDTLYAATADTPATANGAPIAPSEAAAVEDCAMVGDEAMFRHPAWPTPWPAMRVQQRNSLALRMCLVADGAFDAAVALSPKCDWDVAAGDLIARRAGATVCDHKGRGFRYNRSRPVQPSLVCAAPAMAPLILSRVEPIRLPGDDAL